MAHHPELVPAAFYHLHNDILCLRRHAQMYLLCPQSQDRPGPVVSPVWVRNHLAFIYHNNIKIIMVIEHLHGTGLTHGPWHLQSLFPCYHGTCKPLRIKLVIDLQGQKP